jgi:RimJ/RimL family protein N-acetyltransferase
VTLPYAGTPVKSTCRTGEDGAVLEIVEPLRTERLLLRPFTGTDLDDVAAYQSLPEVVRYLYWEVRDRDEVRDVLMQRAERWRLAAEGDVAVLAVVLLETGQVIGEVNLQWSSVAHRQGEFGFVFHPAFHGRGYASEAAARMLDLAFDGLGLHRVYGRTDGANAGSAALMRRLGMRQEAHFVQNEIFKGAWGDELVFAILAEEWRRQRAGGTTQGSGRSNQTTSQ